MRGIPPGGAFALRMAWRETRGAHRHFIHFLACIALGVAALVAVQSFADSLARTVARSAKSLLGADLEIRGSRPLSPDAAAVLADLAPTGVAVTRVRELAAMAQPAGDAGARSQLVELKAVEPGYPFYGRFLADPDRPLAALIGHGRALVHASLLTRLGLAVGDRLRIGDLAFTISGVIREEPDRSLGVFSLGPRVLIAGADLERTGLVRPGSRIRYRTLLKLPAGREVEAFRDALAVRLIDPAIRVLSYAQAQPGFRRFWSQLTMYLGLIGLVALMVGGIGVAVSVRAFVSEKRATIAVLKCLGAGWRQAFAIYLGQTALLGLAGSLVGAALGTALQPALHPVLARLLPLDVPAGVSARAIVNGLGVGIGVPLLFALWPLLEIRRVPPALVLRSQVEPSKGRRPWLAGAAAAGGLAIVALWQAGSWKIGGLFVLGLAGALVLLTLSARLVVRVSRLARRGPLVWRQGMANLHRPGSEAGAILVSLGLAVMLIVAVALLEVSLRRELGERTADAAPAFFFIDIQPDQTEPFRRLVTATTGGRAPELVPVVRSRLSAVDGVPVATLEGNSHDDLWHLRREYVLTWAAAAPDHNVVTAGRWWTAGEAAREPLISVEEEIAKLLGVRPGARLTFDVQGVPVTGRVVNLRRVDWQSLHANFFVIFSPGALDGAPTTYIATAGASRGDEDRVQSAVVAAFPNVTAVPVREVLERVASVLDQIALAMRLVAGLSVLSGLVVMAGALGITRSQRLYQSVILKALGATRGFVARVFALEYGLLGLGAGLSGTALAGVLAWAVLSFALDGAWSWAPATLALGVLAATALASLVGLLGTRRLLGQPPLGVLRSE
jgi:putative ABC transport system permease protein